MGTAILCSMGFITLKNYSTIAFHPIRMSVMKNVPRTRCSSGAGPQRSQCRGDDSLCV